MRVVLLQPPIQDFYQTEIRLQPIGLGYLKAAVQKELPGVQVIVRDFHQGFGRRSIPLPAELHYLRPYYPCNDTSPFSSFFHYYHFGAEFDEIAAVVARERPDLVGISALFSPYYREVLRTAQAIRTLWDAPIVVGGSHASAAPDTLMPSPAIDFIIRGEGERPLVELIRALRKEQPFKEVPNLGFREDGEWHWNPMQENYPLAEIPPPDLSDLEPVRYRYNGRMMTFLITSRGCPHRCSFCAVHLTFGRCYRRRSIEDVLSEMRLRRREGIRVFDFEDDNLTGCVPEMKDLCRGIIASSELGDVELLAMNGISYDSLDAELLQLMRQAGFTQLNISLVSTDDSVRRALQRPHSRHHYMEMVRAAAGLGFRIISYQILGLPDETIDSQIETFCTNIQLPVLLGVSIFYLTPATPLAAGRPPMTEEEIFRSRSTALAFPTPDCSRDDLYTLFITSRIMNFLKGLSLPSEECGIKEALAVACRSGPRGEQGAGRLTQLLNEGRLTAVNRAGRIPLKKFNYRTFERIWNRSDHLVTLESRIIRLDQPM